MKTKKEILGFFEDAKTEHAKQRQFLRALVGIRDALVRIADVLESNQNDRIRTEVWGGAK